MKGSAKFFLGILIVLLILAALGVAGGIFYAMRSEESSARLREGLDRARARARDETAQVDERLDELKRQILDLKQRVAGGDELTSGIQVRLEELRSQIARYEKEVAPVYREKIEDLRGRFQSLIRTIEDKALEARSRIGAARGGASPPPPSPPPESVRP